MKNNKSLRIALITLALTLCIGTALGMVVSADETEETLKTPEIISQNVEYGSQFKLMYAIDASTVNEGPVTLEVYETEPSLGGNASYTYTVDTTEYVEKLDMDCYVFTTNGISYTAMAQNFYIKAVDANGAESAVKRYSVAEYLYERLADTTATTEQVDFYNAAIEFGAKSQILFNGYTSESADLMTKLAYVVVKNGTIDGYTTGVYPIGQTLDLTPSVAGIGSKWSLTTYNDGAAAESYTNLSKVTVYDAAVNVIQLTSTSAYRAEAYTFETATLGSLNGIIGDWATTTKTSEIVEEEGHGNVARLDLSVEGEKLNIYDTYRTSIVDAENATALELSFDIKVQFATEAKNNYIKLYISPNLSGYTTDPQMHEIQIYDGCNKSGTYNGETQSVNSGNLVLTTKDELWGPYASYEDVDPTEWFHIRLVYYKDDTNCYVYINGSEEPFINNRSRTEFTGDLTYALTGWIRWGNAEATVWVDNVFYGYTTDVGPNATTGTDSE